MPLSMAPENVKLEITGFVEGFEMRKRLADLGMNVGLEVFVLSNQYPEPMLILIKEARYAIGRGVAHHIFVQPK